MRLDNPKQHWKKGAKKKIGLFITNVE